MCVSCQEAVWPSSVSSNQSTLESLGNTYNPGTQTAVYTPNSTLAEKEEGLSVFLGRSRSLVVSRYRRTLEMVLGYVQATLSEYHRLDGI